MSDGTFELATAYANAIAGTQIDITTTGTGAYNYMVTTKIHKRSGGASNYF